MPYIGDRYREELFYNKVGHLYNGERNRANEIGYLLYKQQDRLTFEQRASTNALKFLMKTHALAYSDDVPKLFELAEQQDALAISILGGVRMSLKALHKFKSFTIQG